MENFKFTTTHKIIKTKYIKLFQRISFEKQHFVLLINPDLYLVYSSEHIIEFFIYKKKLKDKRY